MALKKTKGWKKILDNGLLDKYYIDSLKNTKCIKYLVANDKDSIDYFLNNTEKKSIHVLKTLPITSIETLDSLNVINYASKSFREQIASHSAEVVTIYGLEKYESYFSPEEKENIYYNNIFNYDTEVLDKLMTEKLRTMTLDDLFGMYKSSTYNRDKKLTEYDFIKQIKKHSVIEHFISQHTFTIDNTVMFLKAHENTYKKGQDNHHLYQFLSLLHSYQPDVLHQLKNAWNNKTPELMNIHKTKDTVDKFFLNFNLEQKLTEKTHQIKHKI